MLSVLLYGCATWALNKVSKRRTDAFDDKCLSKIMAWNDNDKLVNAPREYTDISYLYRSSTPTLGIWAWGKLSRSRLCSSDSQCKRQSSMELDVHGDCGMCKSIDSASRYIG